MKGYILLAFLVMGAVSACAPRNHQSTEAPCHTQYEQMTLTRLLLEDANLPLPEHVTNTIIQELQDPENKCTHETDTLLECLCILKYREYVIYFYPYHQGYTRLNNGEYEYIKYFQSPSFNKFVKENKLEKMLCKYNEYNCINHPEKHVQEIYHLKKSILRFLTRGK